MSNHRQFQELHQRLHGQISLLQEVYGVKPNQGEFPSLYDLLNSVKVDKYLKLKFKQQQYPQLKPGQIDVKVLEQRCTEALRIVQGARWQKESPAFCKTVQVFLEDGKLLLLEKEKEADYRRWLGLKEEIPETQLLPTIRRTKPDRKPGTNVSIQEERSYSGKVPNGQTITEETTKQTSGNTRKQPKQYIDMDAWKKRIFLQEIRNVRGEVYSYFLPLLCFIPFLPTLFRFPILGFRVLIALLIILFLTENIIITGRASGRVKYAMRRELVHAISESYRISICHALAEAHPSKVATEIVEAIEELKQYSLYFHIEVRWQEGASQGYDDRQGSSWSKTYGSPNVTRLEEIVSLAEETAKKWNAMDSKNRALELDFIRTKLRQEQIEISKWITNNNIEIKNSHIQPRRYTIKY
jgi:hypothetical protein